MRRANLGAMQFGDVPGWVETAKPEWADKEKAEEPVEAGWWSDPEWSNPVMKKLRACGGMTGISWLARIHTPGMVSFGRGCRIDDFVHILGGGGIEIGDRVHIAPFASVGGGGQLVMGSYSGLSAGARIVTGSADIRGGYLTNPCCPEEHRNPQRSKVVIGKHAMVFTGAIILPGVEIGEGAIVAAGEVVRHDVPPWSIYGHRLPTPLARKGKEAILEREAQLIERYGF